MSGIPSVGSSGLFGSYAGAVRFIKHGREIVQEGYDKVSCIVRVSGSNVNIDGGRPTVPRVIVQSSNDNSMDDCRRKSSVDR